ncbi:MAG: von Willebrand factor type A domain-containing protein, partial [Planctomycetales bacterium]|nr:von Willebrand factor type A domain-containing protein [Planctomycetales bacterium]
MTPPNEQQLPEDHGDLHDRLMDSVLQESLGGDAPPDLTQRILAAAQHSADAPAETASHAEKSHAASSASHARRWGLLAAIAASLLVAVTLRRMTTVVQMDATNSLPIVAQGPADESKSLRFDDALPANALPANGPPAYDLSAYALPTDASSDFVELLDLSTEAKGESREYFAGQELSRGGANVPASGAVDQLAAVAPTPSRFRIQSQEQTRNPSLSLFEQPPAAHTVDGQGPGQGGDQYDLIVENAFRRTLEENLSTFSIDVDTASYANVRQFLLDMHRLPPADAVRIEELVNYFDYLYAPPSDEEPFAVHVETASCPWEPAHRLVRIGVKGREIDTRARPLSNLVFLIDVSGSMNQPNKLPLLVEGMKMMTRELSENDRVAVVVYASSEGHALPSTPGTEQETILAALDRLSAGGSTAGGAGIKLAYETARQNFIEGGVNRVILCTDGDFNVGTSS